MIKVSSEILKGVISKIAKSARKAGLGDKNLFIRTDGIESIFFYYCGHISSEVGLKCEVQKQMNVTTTIHEMDLKVSVLPHDVTVILEVIGNRVRLKWGKNSNAIFVDVVPELSPPIDIPEQLEMVNWRTGALQAIVKNIAPFTLPDNVQLAQEFPSCLGPQFSKDPVNGHVYVRATDSHKAVRITDDKINWFEEVTASLDMKSLQGLTDVMPEDADISVGVDKSGNVMVFKSGLSTCVFRKLVGTLPNTDAKYNNETPDRLIIDRLELIELCKRVIKLSPSNPVVRFIVNKGKVTAEIPTVLEQQLTASIEGDVESFAMGAKHLEQCATFFQVLDSTKTEELILYIQGPNLPVTIGCYGDDEIRMTCAPHRFDSVAFNEMKAKKTASAGV
ncbi:hypothetical protein [Paenibacillus sp. FSL L8-0709]|uniref:hypothetical protein n=1 Tax=Paenibacillus sp. FSL L8-0709 TaxID=2975312 RepID=UPI0030F61F70